MYEELVDEFEMKKNASPNTSSNANPLVLYMSVLIVLCFIGDVRGASGRI